MTSLRQLEIFLQVVETGSFTAAAESMFMTQPAISWQIKKLEEDLEVALFRKRDRILELSEAGEIMHRAAKEMLGVYHHVLTAMEEYKSLGKGRLAIGASTIPGEYILPSLLSEFCEGHEHLDIRVQIDGSVDILDQLVAAQVDVGIVGAKKILPGIEYLPWLQDDIIAVTAYHNQEIPAETTLHDLTAFVMVGRGVQSGTRMSIEKALQKEGMDLFSFPRYISIATTQGLLSAVAAGMGFAFVSQWAAMPMIARKELRQIKVKNVEIKRHFYIARWETPYPIPSVEAFSQFLLSKQNELSPSYNVNR